MQRARAMTFREKQTVLQDIFDEYHRAKMKLHCLEHNYFYPAVQYQVVREGSRKYNNTNISSLWNADIDSKEELRGLIKSVESIILLLSVDSQRIIEHEFLYKKGADWWREYYAKSTYYRLKRRAMEEALFYLNIY